MLQSHLCFINVDDAGKWINQETCHCPKKGTLATTAMTGQQTGVTSRNNQESILLLLMQIFDVHMGCFQLGRTQMLILTPSWWWAAKLRLLHGEHLLSLHTHPEMTHRMLSACHPGVGQTICHYIPVVSDSSIFHFYVYRPPTSMLFG